MRIMNLLFAVGSRPDHRCLRSPDRGRPRQLEADVKRTRIGCPRRIRTSRSQRSSYAYAVFPAIGSGGAIVGGAFGRGQVFRNDEVIGFVSVTEGTIGAQLGGSNYSEMIFFQDKWTFQKFAANQFAFQASISAVAVESGTGDNLDYWKA